MDGNKKTSTGVYSVQDSNEASCSNVSLDTDAQVLESLRQGQKLSCNCTDSHPLFSHNRKNAQFPCPAKRSMLRLIYNLIVLSLITPFCLAKKLICFISSGTYTQKIVVWMTLFLLLFGATYRGLLDGNWLSGDEWKACSICDLIQGGTKDLRSLKKANYILQSKALQIQFLKEQKQKLQIQLQDLKLTMNNIAYNTVGQILEGYASKGITRSSIEKILKKLEQKLDEDIVQMPDYALQSTGASIVHSRTTRSYHYPDGKYSWMSFIIFPFVKSPDVILQPSYHLGNCWSFPGSQAETVLRLAKEIIPTAVTIQHISKKISPTDEISSAPKDFAIYGLKAEEEEEGTFLGQFTYDMEGFLIQTFQLKNESSELMRYIKLKVINNWGHPKYTCIYRLRVHGNPSASKNCVDDRANKG
ncbi:SUN domain-containing protein 3 [Ahaetulla prasina]|uniref:SUN domain-containing protein 3 n=1 Tax=Ahaetulla prasina TaxID=499056 RepID=UPI0026498C9E|nr:SUN domain-containing protein 3 [Ahaetulla prasina]